MTATPKKVRQRKPQGPFSDELLDQLLAQVTDKDAESLLGESGLIGKLKKQLAERMLAEELGHHLTSEATDEGPGNHRNGAAPRRSSRPTAARLISTSRVTVSPPSNPTRGQIPAPPNPLLSNHRNYCNLYS